MAESNVTPASGVTGMREKDEKDFRSLTLPVTDVEVGDGVLEEKGQLRQGLHQRHIQMIVSQPKTCSQTNINKHLRPWLELLVQACSWDLVKRSLKRDPLASFWDTQSWV